MYSIVKKEIQKMSEHLIHAYIFVYYYFILFKYFLYKIFGIYVIS